MAGLNVEKLDEDGTRQLESAECQICKDDLDVGADVVKLPNCKHCFHEECLKHWFRLQNFCPICRCAMVAATGGKEGKALSDAVVMRRGMETAEEDESEEDAERAAISAVNHFLGVEAAASAAITAATPLSAPTPTTPPKKVELGVLLGGGGGKKGVEDYSFSEGKDDNNSYTANADAKEEGEKVF